METKIEDALKNLSKDIIEYTSTLKFKEILEFELKKDTNLYEMLSEVNKVQGIYFFEIKKDKQFVSFDDFKMKWDKDEIAKTPRTVKGRIINQEDINFLEWIPFYIGKSENIKKRVLEHFKKPANSTTSALKLEERIHLYGLNLRLSFVEVKTEYYDLVMHKIEQELRKKYNPIVGKH
ncbi:hypothetical protein [Flavobacterium sp.]|uniref:hypothetical protein n=1 Tax=Flavobacterium sp. TaxID=239 RepID=UPI0035B1ABAF